MYLVEVMLLRIKQLCQKLGQGLLCLNSLCRSRVEIVTKYTDPFKMEDNLLDRYFLSILESYTFIPGALFQPTMQAAFIKIEFFVIQIMMAMS